jgi:hypothetical protein
MAAPAHAPHPEPAAAQTPPPDGYPAGAPVWIRRDGAWRPGRIITATAAAATVRYRPTEHHGTAVDTVTVAHLAERTTCDIIDDPQPAATAELPRRAAS